jgi:hypothetical protein
MSHSAHYRRVGGTPLISVRSKTSPLTNVSLWYPNSSPVLRVVHKFTRTRAFRLLKPIDWPKILNGKVMVASSPQLPRFLELRDIHISREFIRLARHELNFSYTPKQRQLLSALQVARSLAFAHSMGQHELFLRISLLRTSLDLPPVTLQDESGDVRQGPNGRKFKPCSHTELLHNRDAPFTCWIGNDYENDPLMSEICGRLQIGQIRFKRAKTVNWEWKTAIGQSEVTRPNDRILAKNKPFDSVTKYSYIY